MRQRQWRELKKKEKEEKKKERKKSKIQYTRRGIFPDANDSTRLEIEKRWKHGKFALPFSFGADFKRHRPLFTSEKSHVA